MTSYANDFSVNVEAKVRMDLTISYLVWVDRKQLGILARSSLLSSSCRTLNRPGSILHARVVDEVATLNRRPKKIVGVKSDTHIIFAPHVRSSIKRTSRALHDN